MAPATFKKLPGVLSFKRGHVISDAVMMNRIAEDAEHYPVLVIRHGIRGTQNVNDGDRPEGATGRTTAAAGARNVSNIQQTETAKLDPRANAMVVQFSMAMLDIAQGLDSCVAVDKTLEGGVRESINDFISRAKSSEGLNEVARRYARNIANGRWLWRNRTIASAIEVVVADKGGDKPIATFNAIDIPTDRFDNYSDGERAVAAELAKQMRGESLEGITVTVTLTMSAAGAVEVFPSQNYIEDKPTGFSRPLYKIGVPAARDATDIRVMGQAAIRDQKLFNAIRTIDTWYPDFAETGLPIAVEPNGASLSQQEFFRNKSASSFQLFKRLAQIDPDSDDGMFCIAALDRGGVYSESDKQEKANKAAGAAAGASEDSE